jgi:hypothetical protein
MVKRSCRSAQRQIGRLNLELLAVRSSNGEKLDAHANLESLTTDHTLILFGPDRAHEVLGGTIEPGGFDLTGAIQ